MSLEQTIDDKLIGIRKAGIAQVNADVYNILIGINQINKKKLTKILTGTMGSRIALTKSDDELNDYLSGFYDSLKKLGHTSRLAKQMDYSTLYVFQLALREKDKSMGVNGKDTGISLLNHQDRVSMYVLGLAREIGFDERTEITKVLFYSSLLHDIGKIGISNEILTKPGELTEQEWAIMKKHPLEINILRAYDGGYKKDFLDTIKSHHERWDGSGYPRGLKEKQIPHLARILTIADTFDAMTSRRPWNRTLKTPEEAIREIQELSGRHYDPDITSKIECFIPAYYETEAFRSNN